MSKYHKRWQGGRYVREVVYNRPEPNDSGKERAAKMKCSSAAQKALNHKNAKIKLQMIMAANFNGRDYFVTLTYSDEYLPRNFKDACDKIRRYNAQMRRQRCKNGIDFRYIYATESISAKGRYHHHAVISASDRGFKKDIEEIQSLWLYGDVDVQLLISKHAYAVDRNAVDFGEVAGYMVKEGRDGKPLGSQTYTCSRNLERPKPTGEYVHEETQPAQLFPVGAIIISRESGCNEFGGYEFVEYLLPAPRRLKARVKPNCRNRENRFTARGEYYL